ncbi:o-succinylbenzoate synthase [Rufibacter sp. LB8]|uniref:o-succinylbenzoate synthase n=1 Tax=Rufibacter sp. LB8 TaxID=2777781 RepID=UPI00178C3BD5|nr:o-succinylbenzoate synthase [Rufibacter sp. LB8]
MPFVLTPFKRDLQFKFQARTSRGAMHVHQACYLRLHHTRQPEKVGWGEGSPLPGLSLDYSPDFFAVLQNLCQQYNDLQVESIDQEDGEEFWQKLKHWPSVCFAWETAWVDLLRGGQRHLYDNAFAKGQKSIKINGLIWMGEPNFMREQITKKMEQGFTCLKLKIGALDFAQEIKLLREIRSFAPAQDLEIRLDANGAFAAANAEEKIRQLAAFDIHSLEQPIQPGQWNEMCELCEVSPIPIALDEEMIGVMNKEEKWNMLNTIRPPYIILKPTLVGGLFNAREWIQVAQSLGIDWWVTSALESNIGLNAVAQFAGDFDNPLPQGLGTGQLYVNNLEAPLEVRGEDLWFDPNGSWELPA